MRLRAAGRLMTVGVLSDLAYRAAIWFWALELATQIYLYAVLWRSLYAAGQTVAGIGYAGAVTYSTLATLQGFSLPSADGQIRGDVRSGAISYGLLRPTGYLWQLFATSLGNFWYGLAWIAFGLGVASLLSVAYWPASGGQLALYGLSLFLAFLVNYHLRLLLGLTAFWTVELFGISTVFNFTVRILSGGIVPLWFFPEWLLRAASLLPFAAVAHAPLSIFIGRLEGADALRAVGLQAVWALALVAAGRGLTGLTGLMGCTASPPRGLRRPRAPRVAAAHSRRRIRPFPAVDYPRSCCGSCT